MSKILSIINDLDEANQISNLTDGYIVPLKDLSMNYHHYFNINQIKEIKKLNKEIFVSINKNIHNNMLDKLKETLEEIDKLDINGIIFYDISIINLKKKLNLKTPLVWAQEHLSTNYGTVNFWYDNGAKFTYLSSEITKREIMEIKENSKAKLMINIFGYIPMFTSKRHLVKNYTETFNINEKENQKTIRKEGKKYIIEDEESGTTVYSEYILNATEEDFKDIDYLVFNSNFIKTDDFKQALLDYKENKPNKYPKKLGFLFEDTIYKVK